MTDSDPAAADPDRAERDQVTAARLRPPTESTVGTGTVVAVTCTAVAIFVTVIGILILLFILGVVAGD